MHPLAVPVKPPLLVALDTGHRISSKWIAVETGKKHYNVLRDIDMLKDEAASNLSTLYRPNGDIAEVMMGLPVAILVLSRYEGPKAVHARQLVLEALNYFIHRAPYVEGRLVEMEEDNARLRNENQTLATTQKKSPKLALTVTSKSMETVAITATFSGVEFFPVKMPLNSMTNFQRGMAKIIHDMKVAKGVRESFDKGAIEAAEELLARFTEEEFGDKMIDVVKLIKGVAAAVFARGKKAQVVN